MDVFMCIYINFADDFTLGVTSHHSSSIHVHESHLCICTHAYVFQGGYGSPSGFDRTRNVEIGNKNIVLHHLEEAYTSEHWLVRIYRFVTVILMNSYSTITFMQIILCFLNVYRSGNNYDCVSYQLLILQGEGFGESRRGL